MTSWLTLQEYSYQKGISISTLRRKIKNKNIEFKLQNGRYFLKADEKTLEKQTNENASYNQQLQEKNKELLSLKYKNEDLKNLVHYLEIEKQELLKYIEKQLY